ncbi:SH3 domain-containing protein [Streptomyces sp. HU2014]|uniref:SH3 domain-containing protein n=1 Tax=Streptomyces sp. HU2014 TaxID=2939414 RepID=UPI00200EB8DC|nr:SH3 domain-containing protein [Streptomyces sp. HU2014]UQI48560.1 SH3 domain-containing protein [Streptomyces sp. HU2014]
MAVGEINESSESNGAAEAAGTGEAQQPAALSVQSAGTIYYPVAPGVQVNVRRGPNTGSQIVKVLGENSRVAIRCQTRGETVSGPYGTTDVWDSIAPGQYVSDAYVKTGSDGFVAIRCS